MTSSPSNRVESSTMSELVANGYFAGSVGGHYGLGAGIGASVSYLWPLPGNDRSEVANISLIGVGGWVVPEVSLSLGYTYAPINDPTGEAVGISTPLFTLTSNLNPDDRLPDLSYGFTFTLDIGRQFTPVARAISAAYSIAFGPLGMFLPVSYHVERSWSIK